jgi:hypothetical protein
MLKKIITITLIFIHAFLFADEYKALFLGNSHSAFNNLPQLVHDLALSAGDTLVFESNTPGGCTLGHPQNGHLTNPISLELINYKKWDFVILQEHSLFPVIDYYKNTFFYPGAFSLDSLIKLNNICTETILCIVRGKKYGGDHCIYENCSPDFTDFFHMQDSMTAATKNIAQQIECTLAPAGESFRTSMQNGNLFELFYTDDSHPNLAGSYLIACTYYATIFQKSPIGLSFTAGLNENFALALQEYAHETVFTDPDQWLINANKPQSAFDFVIDEFEVQFNNNSINANKFLWDFGDGTFDTVINPTHVYSEFGNYNVTLTASNQCHEDTSIDSIFLNGAGIIKPQEKLKISVFPNPATDNIQIEISNSKSSKYEISITNLIGRNVYSKRFFINRNNKILIDSRNFGSGIYLLHYSGDENIIKKIVIN